MRLFFFSALTLALLSSNLQAQRRVNVAQFTPLCDSLSVLIQERTTVKAFLKLRSVTTNGESLNFNFTESLGDIPWKKADELWLKEKIAELLPDNYSRYSVGMIKTKGLRFNDIVTPDLHNDGEPHHSRFRVNDPKGTYEPLVETVGAQHFNKGLDGRYIALWQSHGRYYETKTGRWEWQRAPLFTTVEDMYTQSYVLPFLMPMLENAGAYVMTPRERDTQRNESVVDNDPAFDVERIGNIRRSGRYTEKGEWKDAGVGFADAKAVYTGIDNPFTMGTARMIKCEEKAEASVKWVPEIAESGQYAVYVSYKTLPKSTRSAHYTVKHLGGTSEFVVNQQMGGGTWIYLGTFDFDKYGEGCVVLDNGTPQGRTFTRGSIVTADAVRFGGGMGKIARGDDDVPVSEYVTSGLPSYTEGALYSMQWAGADSTLLRAHDNDYTNDYANRGTWVSLMSGGSFVNPENEGKGIPVDMSFAFHSDAGVSPDDSIIGTLCIYTLMSDNKRSFPNGEDRMSSREYTDYVQTQIVDDIRRTYNPEWSRRRLQDRSYSESRTPGVPAMLLELLSHQNFADMKCGLDPSFRFTVSRAIYKGMLKYLSNRYGFHYEVQPLPVNSFAATLEGDKVRLSWEDTIDSLETTAVPKGYILYRRLDDGVFDGGTILEDVDRSGERLTTLVPITPGHIHSFKIVAFNDGGKSFPSEILCAGRPKSDSSNGEVLIVNNFSRVSAPAWFDTPQYAGFNSALDRGVPYGMDISYIGDMYESRRDIPWLDDDNPGFGGSFSNMAGVQFVGNTFDYPYIHAKALLALGHPFSSASSAAFAKDSTIRKAAWAADIICGKQITTMTGTGKVAPKYSVFPQALQNSIRNFTSNGGNILISGAYIATDAWDEIYPVPVDTLARETAQTFVKDVLGYKWLTNHASKTGHIRALKGKIMDSAYSDGDFSLITTPNERIYNVENPDGILPADPAKAEAFMRYTDTEIPAAVSYRGNGYKTVCLGFPVELIDSEDGISSIINAALQYFSDTQSAGARQ